MKVTQDENKPVPAEILAESIRKIGDATRRLDASGLNDKAITLLLSSLSGVSKTDVGNVLWALRNLEASYLKKKTK
jgi:hypothetical protein